MSISLSVEVVGYERVFKKLDNFALMATRPSIPARQAAIWLVAQTMRVFAEGGRPEKWAPLSMMTLFIRSKRDGKQTNSTKPMNDSGRLKGSFIPFVSEDGTMFGASTNVEYAGLMQYGGKGEPHEVSIAAFTRKRNHAQGKDYANGSLTKATQRVKAYIMHMKGGNIIPARPFFPEGVRELGVWGYHDKIKRIFAEFFAGGARA